MAYTQDQTLILEQATFSKMGDYYPQGTYTPHSLPVDVIAKGKVISPEDRELREVGIAPTPVVVQLVKEEIREVSPSVEKTIPVTNTPGKKVDVTPKEVSSTKTVKVNPTVVTPVKE